MTEMEVVVGIQEDEKSDDGDVTIAQYAAWNEYGTEPDDGPPIPARPFMRTAFDNNTDKIFQSFYRQRVAMDEGKITQEQALNRVGLKLQAIVKKTIVSEPWTPNKQSTIDAKGEGKPPLIDSSTMLKSITYTVQPYGTSKDE
ncbi:hypothetical protein OLZ31_02380 [Enterobacter asburiae]|nr:hypothetical protein [Enterobacter asburiae]